MQNTRGNTCLALMALMKEKTRHTVRVSIAEQMGLEDGKTFLLSCCTGYSGLCWIDGLYDGAHV